MVGSVDLQADEDIVIQESPSWTAYPVTAAVAVAGTAVGLALLAVDAVVGSAVVWVGTLLYLDGRRRIHRSSTALTTDRLVAVRRGWLDGSREEISVEEIRGVDADPGRFGGRLAVRTDDGGACDVEHVRDPESFAWRVEELIEEGH